MPLTNGLEAAFSKLAARGFIVQKILNGGFHLTAVIYQKVVFAGMEQVFFIAPVGTDQRNSARQRLKNADGGNAAEPVGILPAGNVNR
jgi:hypothetical protein